MRLTKSQKKRIREKIHREMAPERQTLNPGGTPSPGKGDAPIMLEEALPGTGFCGTPPVDNPAIALTGEVQQAPANATSYANVVALWEAKAAFRRELEVEREENKEQMKAQAEIILDLKELLQQQLGNSAPHADEAFVSPPAGGEATGASNLTLWLLLSNFLLLCCVVDGLDYVAFFGRFCLGLLFWICDVVTRLATSTYAILSETEISVNDIYDLATNLTESASGILEALSSGKGHIYQEIFD